MAEVRIDGDDAEAHRWSRSEQAHREHEREEGRGHLLVAEGHAEPLPDQGKREQQADKRQRAPFLGVERSRRLSPTAADEQQALGRARRVVSCVWAVSISSVPVVLNDRCRVGLKVLDGSAWTSGTAACTSARRPMAPSTHPAVRERSRLSARLSRISAAVTRSSPFSTSVRNTNVIAVAPIPTVRNATRGELSATNAPPSDSPSASDSAPIDSTALIRRPCSAGGVSRWTRLITRGPLDAVADPADDGRDAGELERARGGEADVGEAHRERAGGQHRAQPALRRAREDEAADHHAHAPQRRAAGR